MTTLPPHPRGSKAQWIAQEVHRRILEREWRQGDRIPDEAELAVEFGVARATVNKALQLVADEGLLDRRRRAGTHVAVNPVRKATFSIPVLRDQIEQAGMTYRHRLVGQRRALPPPAIADLMGLPHDRPLIHQRNVHLGDDRPFQVEERWINPEAIPEVEQVDFRKHNANEWLVRNAPYLRAELTFSAEIANYRDARLLACKQGQALLIVQRTTWNEQGAITHVRLAFPPGYSMSTTH